MNEKNDSKLSEKSKSKDDKGRIDADKDKKKVKESSEKKKKSDEEIIEEMEGGYNRDAPINDKDGVASSEQE